MRTRTSSRLHYRPTLLCIDDSEAELEIRKTVLQFHGYRVLTAENGREGLELIAENKIDVVLLDYQMPKMNGVTVARKIRRISPGTHIILYSGFLAHLPERQLRLFDALVGKGESLALLPSMLERIVKTRIEPSNGRSDHDHLHHKPVASVRERPNKPRVAGGSRS